MDTCNTMKKITKEAEKKPAIYLRVFNKQIMYIGETNNLNGSRPWRRDDAIGDYDHVITIPACNNEKRRRYWEAYCVVKFKPKKQKNIQNYYTILKKPKLEHPFFKFKREEINKKIKKETIKFIYAHQIFNSAFKQINLLKKERSKFENDCTRTTRNW